MKTWHYIFLAWILSAMPIAAGPAAYAQEEKTVPATRTEITLSYAPVVKKAAPAVVNIFTKGKVTVVQNLSPFMNDPFFSQFFGQNSFGGVPREQAINSLGSGVIIKPDGLIVTSNHVIRDAQEITVVLADKRQFEARLVMTDPQSDLAFLRIKTPEALPSLEMRDSDSLEVGDLVLAIGNPFGVGQTVTNGIVSGLARKAVGVSDYQFFIQTDAAINPGNSGGALVDMNGRLIGINTAIYSKSGGSLGIGFAIPANMVRSLMDGKMEGGRIVHAWFGFSVQPVTPDIAESMGMAVPPQGVLVKSLYPGSPAEKGGLKVGDIILAAGGTETASVQDLQYRIALAKIGQASEFKIMRAGKPQTVAIEPSVPPENPRRDQKTLSGRNPFNNVTVANLSPALAIELGMDETASGVAVVAAGNSAAGVNAGFAPGDTLLEVNGTKITSAAQLEKLLKNTRGSWKIMYQRGGNVVTLTVEM